MANVIHIRRQPTGLEQAGQSMQDLASNFIQHTLAMAQQQNAQNMQMMGLGMQERRLADANARDDRRWKENTAMQERRFAQEDKWKEAQLSLQKQQLGRSYAAMDKPQLVQGTDAYGRPTFGWVSPGSTAPKMIDFTGGGQQGGASTIPGLDAAAGAGMNEVLSPGWSPLSSGGQNSGPSLADLGVKAGILPAPQNDSTQPPADGMQGAMPMASGYGQAQGATFTPQADTRPVSQLSLAELGQRAGVLPGAPQQGANSLAPGTVVDGSGKMVQLPDNVPWGKQEKQYVNGVEYYGARTPNGVYFKVGGPVPPTAAERKDMQAVEKNARAEKATVSGGMTIADAALRSADESLKLLDEYGGRATGAAAQSWLGEGTMGRKLGFGQGMADLHRAMQPMQTASMMEMIKEMKDQSPSGALNMRITQLEAVMLSGILGSLELDQNPDQLRKNILAHKEIYQQTMQAMTDLAKEKGYPVPGYIADRYGAGQQQQPGGTSAQLPAGFRLVN